MGSGGYNGEEDFHRKDWLQLTALIQDWFAQSSPLTLGQVRLFLARVGADLKGKAPESLALGNLETALEEHGLGHAPLYGVLELVDAAVRHGLKASNANEVFQSLDVGIVAPALSRRGLLTASQATSLAAFASSRPIEADVLRKISIRGLRHELDSAILSVITVRDLRELLEAVAVRG